MKIPVGIFLIPIPKLSKVTFQICICPSTFHKCLVLLSYWYSDINNNDLLFKDTIILFLFLSIETEACEGKVGLDFTM